MPLLAVPPPAAPLILRGLHQVGRGRTRDRGRVLRERAVVVVGGKGSLSVGKQDRDHCAQQIQARRATAEEDYRGHIVGHRGGGGVREEEGDPGR